MPKFKNLTGKRFGNWIVLELCKEKYYDSSGRGKYQYLCECQCDNKTRKIIIGPNLTSGKTRSCGCLKGKLISESKFITNKYDLSGDYGKGYTEKGEEFWFDLEDYDLISEYCWHTDSVGYLVAGIKNNQNKYTTIKLHRLIMGVKDPVLQVDHIGHNLFDNRKKNLRVVSNQENARNKRILSSNTSGATGVYLDKKCNVWVAQIKTNEKVIVLGRYSDFDAAVSVRKEAEEKYFGEYSYDNSIEMYKQNEDV